MPSCPFAATSTAAPLGIVCAADPSDNGSGDVWIADPDSVILTCHAVDVGADIDIIAVAPAQVLASVLAHRDVGVAGADTGKRPATYCGVAVSTNVMEKRASSVGCVRVTEHVVMKCA